LTRLGAVCGAARPRLPNRAWPQGPAWEEVSLHCIAGVWTGNRDSATSMAVMLKFLGNEVVTAHDGIEAVESAEAFRPQVILMDVGMP
jgi:hypothetical protein